MFKGQFLLLFLILNVQNSFSLRLTTLDAVRNIQTVIQQIDEFDFMQFPEDSINQLLNTKIDSSSICENLELLKPQLVKEASLCRNFSEFLSIRDPRGALNDETRFQTDSDMVNFIQNFKSSMELTREETYARLTTLTEEAINARNGGCIGPAAFERIHHEYLGLISFEAYGHLVLTVTRGMQSFILKVAQPHTSDYSVELQNQYLMHTEKFISLLRKIQLLFSANCNGENSSPIQGESFIELEGLFSPKIFSFSGSFLQKHLSYGWGKNCNDRVRASSDKVWFDNASTCNPYFMHCRYLGTGEACSTSHWVDSPNGKGELVNHYLHISSSELGFGGQKTDCSGPNKKRIDFNKNSKEFFYCYCQCLTVEHNVELGVIKSDTSNNYVIVGVRFKFIGNTLTLQAAQGKLGSLGYITDFTWIPMKSRSGKLSPITNDNRRFYFNDLRLKSGYIMTEIGLNSVVFRDRNIGYKIEVAGNFYDVQTGKLSLQFYDGTMIGNHDYERGRELKFPPVNPAHTSTVNMTLPSRPGYTFTRFQPSRMSDDVGHSSLPLFDSPSSTIPREMKPLNGIKTYHRGSPHHSGFISLEYYQVNNYQFNDYIEELEKSVRDL